MQFYLRLITPRNAFISDEITYFIASGMLNVAQSLTP